MNDPSSNPCPECGNPVPADSQHHICPACLMAQALASQTLDGEKTPSSPPPEPEEIADKFPQFEILECLGRGGMGIVYKARQKSLNRLVAIKILAPEREHDARFAERFAREAELLAKLSHPHIVTIHDFGETGGLYFLVMEFVDGVNLRDLLREGKLESKQALAIVPPICEALQYAHDKGIVHRDIKPENLLLDRDGRIKIADFGIASLIGASAEKSGTPPYMAPEQRGVSSEVDHRADIYALGVVFYEMLTGERPAEDLVAPSKKTPLDARLDEMVLRALEKEPEKRYQTAGDFRTMVETMGGVPLPVPRVLGQAPFKTGRGRISVQEEPGAGLGYPKLGELAIHADHLVISLGGSRREVPLGEVRGLGTTVPPWWFSPAGHRFAAIDFDEDGKRRKLVFMAGEGAFRLVDSTQLLATEWLIAIQRAVKDSTGYELPISNYLPVFPIKSNWSLIWLLPLMVAALILGKVLMSGGMGSDFGLTDLIVLLPILIPISIPLVILVFRNRTIRVSRGETGASALRAPSSRFGASPLLIGCGVICLLLFILFILFGGSLFWLRNSKLNSEMEKQARVSAMNVADAKAGALPDGARFLATLRFINLPSAIDNSALNDPKALAQRGMRVLGVMRAVVAERQEGAIQLPWVMGREGSPRLTNEGTLFLRMERVNGVMQAELETTNAQESQGEAPARRSLGRHQLSPGQPLVLEELPLPFDRKQLAVLTVEEAPADRSLQPIAASTGGYRFGPEIEKVLADPAVSKRECLIDFDSGNLAGIPDDAALKGRLASQPVETVKNEIRALPGAEGVDAVGRIGPSGFGLVSVNLDPVPAAWEMRDATSMIYAMDSHPMPKIPSRVQELRVDAGFAEGRQSWSFRTDSGSMGLLRIEGPTDDRAGVKVRYKLVEEPSIGWDPEPGLHALPVNADEEALISGGRSPDGRYEVRVKGRPFDPPYGYELLLADLKTSQVVHEFEGVGGYMPYSTAKDSCVALWHPSGKFVVVSDRGTKRTQEIYLLSLTRSPAKIAALPDYVANALGRVGDTQIDHESCMSTPTRWDGNDLHVQLQFAARKGKFTCEVVLSLAYSESSSPRVELKSCSIPQPRDQ